jgi:hypothetical protein
MSSCKYLSLLHIQDENQFNNIHIIYRNERGIELVVARPRKLCYHRGRRDIRCKIAIAQVQVHAMVTCCQVVNIYLYCIFRMRTSSTIYILYTEMREE